MALLDDFFANLDREWDLPSEAPIPLHIIGSGALMLQTGYERGTKDADVLELQDLSPLVVAALTRLAGPKTRIHQRHRIYLDIVSGGLPFLPQKPTWHPYSAARPLSAFELHVLDVVDVVVSKLKRFNSDDRDDIDAVVKRGAVAHGALVERFDKAVDWCRGDARAEHLPRYVHNLNRVERDMFVVSETAIDLDDIHY
jgi:hypothetical protein